MPPAHRQHRPRQGPAGDRSRHARVARAGNGVKEKSETRNPRSETNQNDEIRKKASPDLLSFALFASLHLCAIRCAKTQKDGEREECSFVIRISDLIRI